MSRLFQTLGDGTKVSLPAYGVGTAWYKSENHGTLNREMIESVKKAIKAGYTHFDNAEVYSNEEEFGAALKESGADRSKLFITTKVLKGISDIPTALKTGLSKMGLDYVDLYLIHSHNFAGQAGKPSLKEAWREMEKLKDAGLAKHIGVSNYRPEDILETLKECHHKPEVNQIEIHPHCFADAKIIIDLCQKHGIVPEAYGPLVPLREGMAPELEHELKLIANEITEAGTKNLSGEDGKGQVSLGQLMLRWNYQLGCIPISTSGKSWRMEEMLKIGDFTLTEEQMQRITRAGSKHHYRKFGGMLGTFEGSKPESR